MIFKSLLIFLSDGCGGVLTTPTGSFKTPRYPQNYPKNVICQWKIQVPNDQKIRLEFSKFDLEPDTQCRFDYLSIYDGSSVASTELQKMCGSKEPTAIPTIDSTSNVLTVLFVSDSSVTAGGFQARWFDSKDGQTSTTRVAPTTTSPPTTNPITQPEGNTLW